MQFRKDINGLRAIAVIAVVLFHFNASWLPGGFAGVDVFFVISGYLMTSIVVKKFNKKSFNLIEFYLARANRIIPALAALVLCLLFILPFILPLPDYQTYAKHAASAIVFISNIVFYKENGYFETASQFNWLLHTWSLSVEWQFYIVYPIVLCFLYKFVKAPYVRYVVLVGLLFGFIASVIITQIKPSFAYFMLPTRGWELLVGAMVFYFPLKLSHKKSFFLEILGLVLILISIMAISGHNPWPGYLAAVPVLGAALVLMSNRQASVFTNNFVFQKLGLWSYSIYLWHWPLVVFGHYIDSHYWFVLGGCLSIVLGAMSFYYVESVRIFELTIAGKKRKFTPVFATLACLAIAASTLIYVENFSVSNPEKVEAFTLGHNYRYEHNIKFPEIGVNALINAQTTKEAEYLVLGDSNIAHFAYGMSVASSHKFILSWVSSCLNFPDYTNKPYASWMTEKWMNLCKSNLKKIEEFPDKPVILGQHWLTKKLVCSSDDCTIPIEPNNYLIILNQQLHKIVERLGNQRKLFLVGLTPAPLESIVQCLKKLNNSDCQRLTNEFQGGDRLAMNKVLDNFAKQYQNVEFIDPFDAVCDDSNLCKTVIDENNLFFDKGHLSQYGSKVFWRYIDRKIGEYKKQLPPH